LEYDASIECKAEYYNGEIFDMGGGSPAHSGIAANFVGAAFGMLGDSSCNVFNSDLRVYISHERSFVYPDASIVCGQLEMSDIDRNSILNPVVLVEVISPSSEAFDRIGKFNRYASILSLREYVLIEQSRMQVDVFMRVADGKWLMSRYSQPSEQVKLESVGIAIPVGLLYRGVELAKAHEENFTD
jgi:Uma2 family endonuclease